MANKTHFVSGSAGSLSHVPPHKKQRQSSTKTTNVLAAPTNHGQLTPSTHMQFKFTQESKTGFDKNHIFTSKSFDLYRLLYIVICPLHKTTSQFKSKPLHWIKPQIKPNNLTKMPHELCINLKHMQMRRLLLNPQITIISNLPSLAISKSFKINANSPSKLEPQQLMNLHLQSSKLINNLQA